MSADALPISSSRFAEALTSLPLANLHLKAAELRNSIAHLESSNLQLKPFADEGDRDCAEAIAENVEVIARMEQRVELLRKEVESRGYKWDHGPGDGDQEANEHVVNGGNGRAENVTNDPDTSQAASATTALNGGSARRRLTDEELARRVREQLDEDMDEDDGVHL